MALGGGLTVLEIRSLIAVETHNRMAVVKLDLREV